MSATHVVVLLLCDRLSNTTRSAVATFSTVAVATASVPAAANGLQTVSERPLRFVGTPRGHVAVGGGTGWVLPRGHSRGYERRGPVGFQPRAARVVRLQQEVRASFVVVGSMNQLCAPRCVCCVVCAFQQPTGRFQCRQFHVGENLGVLISRYIAAFALYLSRY